MTAGLARGIDGFILIGGAAAALYHFLYVFTTFQGSTEHYITHISIGVVLCGLVSIAHKLRVEAETGRHRLAALALALVTLAGIAGLLYMRLYAEDLEDFFPYFDPIDIPFGYMAIGAIIILTWVHWGGILPILTLIGIIYFFFGHLIPRDSLLGALHHPPYDHYYVLGYLGLSPTQGFIGWIIPVSANFIFLFIVFGRVLVHTGVVEMFLELGRALGNRLRPGPAYTATVASAMVGTVTGAAAANVVLTGSVTIPTMKSVGFKARFAAAIEACASTGGQILPPIMGAAAFVMAQFINVPYIEIARRAILPAFLYFVAIAIAIYFLVQALGISSPKAQISARLIWRRMPCFLVPLGVIIGLLMQRYSPMYAATYGVVTLLLISMVFPETRLRLIGLLRALSEGAVQGAQLAIVLSCVGIFSQVIITTDLGAKLGLFVVGLTDGTLLPTLIAAMVICIVLGVSTPTTPAYILTALAVAPALVALGVEAVGAHFFVFYFAIFSTLTPPVAIAVLAAARLADSDFLRTSIDAFRLALVAYFMPFALIYHPALLDFPHIGLSGLIAAGSLVLLCVTYSAFNYGYFGLRLPATLRAGFGVASLSGVLFLVGFGEIYVAAQVLISIICFGIAVWHDRRAVQPTAGPGK